MNIFYKINGVFSKLFNHTLLLLSWFHSITSVFFNNLLEFLNWFHGKLLLFFENTKIYLTMLSGIMINLSILIGKISLLYIPGIIAGLLFSWYIGIFYMVLITLIGISFKVRGDQNEDENEIDTDLTWLSFFPADWAHNTSINKLIQDLVDLYNILTNVRKNSCNPVVRSTAKKTLKTMRSNFSWIRKHIRSVQKIQKIKNKLERNGVKSYSDELQKRIDSVIKKVNDNIVQITRLKDSLFEIENIEFQTILDNYDNIEHLEDQLIFLNEYKKLLDKV